MKKIILNMIIFVAIFMLNGCGGFGYDNDYNNYADDDFVTLFLVDEQGFSYADVPYKCDSMAYWSHTARDGEFSFFLLDTCKFDFNGLNGVFGDSMDDVVRIVDDRNSGKGGIGYGCESFGISSTYSDGSFDYDEDDICTFYL